MKVAINTRFGAFGLPRKELDRLREEAPELFFDWGGFRDYEPWVRAHPALVAAVEREIETGNDELAVVEVPDGIEFGIFDYDGLETVYEVGHTWG